jgi:hypothetical protein
MPTTTVFVSHTQVKKEKTMLDDSQFLEGVNEEAPELLEAATTILEFTDVFDEAELTYDDDGVACVSVDFSLAYPDAEEPKPGESWTAGVYVDEAEVLHLRAGMSDVKIITARERMTLDEFVEVLWKVRERLVEDQA